MNKTLPNDESLSRRKLIGAAAGAALGIHAMPAKTLAAPVPVPAASERYDFLLLGDLHLDRLDHHDVTWLKTEKPNDIRQVENYSRITREIAPALFAEMKEHTVANPRIAFTTHIGDFVEGLAGTPALALRQAHESLALVSAHGPAKPFLFCKGNHDITGPGADTARRPRHLPFQVAFSALAKRFMEFAFLCTSLLFPPVPHLQPAGKCWAGLPPALPVWPFLPWRYRRKSATRHPPH